MSLSDQRFSCLVISQNLAVTGPMTSTEVRCSNVTTNAVTINNVVSDIIEANTIVTDSITLNTNTCTTFTTDVVTDTPNMRNQSLPLLVSYGRGGNGGIQVSNGGINGIAGSSGCVFIYYNT